MKDTSGTEETFLEDLAPIVDGEAEALERHAEALSTADACRDLHHEASEAAKAVRDAGCDYETPESLSQRVFEQIEQENAHTEPKASGEVPERGSTPTRKAPLGNFPGARKLVLVTGGLLAAAAAVALTVRSFGGPADSAEAARGALRGRLARVERAGTDGKSGVELRLPHDHAFRSVEVGASIPVGARVRTDRRTRARLVLSDGTTLTLDRETDLDLNRERERALRLHSGRTLVEVDKHEGWTHATFETPSGVVRVLGTKFALEADPTTTRVAVTRGKVALRGLDGNEIEVRAGQEGMISKNVETPLVAPANELARAVRWSEFEIDREELPLQGLGELRAHRPGERQERERPLHLARHTMRVRIAGSVARTEIEETFRNESAETLEGVYRFPLPPGARIASLALEVDGTWQQGSFVDRDRAKKIWRGVIRNATPVAQRQQEEFIWVPGPWRDPALLEWQQGGRFELRIFPIPAHGERRIRLVYTETLSRHASGRSYVYPLAHSGDESTRVGRFEFDATALGETSLALRGYDANPHVGQRVSFSEDNFLPVGDIVLETFEPDANKELTWWTFSGDAAAKAPVRRREGDEDVYRLHEKVSSDERPFVVLALRPSFDRSAAATDESAAKIVLVVDRSQSMFGERFARARRLAVKIVEEMDPSRQVQILACDATCDAMHDGPQTPSASLAEALDDWLGAIRPAGASDLSRALMDAGRAASGPARIVYIGDGSPTVGPRRQGSLAYIAQRLADARSVRISTVGLGSDADRAVLSAVARAGRGHYLAYRPGESATTGALHVLETTYGASLEDVSIELPRGLSDMAPAMAPTLRQGDEILIAARMGQPRVRGKVLLRGLLGGRSWQRSYSVDIEARSTKANAFVPRLWATKTIEDLELDPADRNKAEIVALSKAFGVMSRRTSLLVLESEAMFRAFGVDRARPSIEWTGDEEVIAESMPEDDARASGLTGLPNSTGALLGGKGYASGFGLGATTPGRGSVRARKTEAPQARMAPRPASDDLLDSAERKEREDRPAEPPETARPERPSGPVAQPRPVARPPIVDRRGPMILMRRVWTREGRVLPEVGRAWVGLDAIEDAEERLRENPDSRDRHRALVRLLSRASNLSRAVEVAERWLERDPLDPEALTYLSDALGREGERDKALRLLSGIVDLEPGNVTLQERLANAFDRAGMDGRACAHRITLAEIDPTVPRISAAIRCQEAADEVQRHLLEALDETSRQEAIEQAERAPTPEPVRGDLVVDGRWREPADVDISLITPQGTRLSWMGGRTNVVGELARTSGRERLGLRRAAAGTYILEVSRTDPDDTRPIDGTLKVSVLGTTRRLPFTLSGTRTVAGRIDVVRHSHLEPVRARAR